MRTDTRTTSKRPVASPPPLPDPPGAVGELGEPEPAAPPSGPPSWPSPSSMEGICFSQLSIVILGWRVGGLGGEAVRRRAVIKLVTGKGGGSPFFAMEGSCFSQLSIVILGWGARWGWR